MGSVQSKTQKVSYQLCVGAIAFILWWMLDKWNSSLLFSLDFFFLFVHYLWSFIANRVKYSANKIYNVITVNSRLHDMATIACYDSQSTISFFGNDTHLLRQLNDFAWT